MLCWDKAWKEFGFSAIDEDAIRKYLDVYSEDLGFELFQKYIQYMGSQLKNNTKQSSICSPIRW